MQDSLPSWLFEHGSEFHWPVPLVGEQIPFPKAARYFGSGRDALRALIEHGQNRFGWKRLLIPSYFCQEVTASLVATGIDCHVYSDSPFQDGPDLTDTEVGPGDAVLIMNYFGLRTGFDANTIRAKGAAILEDHSHDPWSDWALSSQADFVVISLRKTLPVAEGGVVWSPIGRELPDEAPVTEEREEAAERKFLAMVLKGLYLDGFAVQKDAFRELALSGEEHIASGKLSGMTNFTRRLLSLFPTGTWREVRKRNHSAAAEILKAEDWLEVLKPASQQTVPFSLVVLFQSREVRDAVRAGLIERKVYPAILWTLDEPVLPGIPDAHRDLAGRMLSLHCDFRYDEATMRRVAQAIVQLGPEARKEGI